MTDNKLQDKKVAVLIDTEYIPEEIDYYLRQLPRLGATVDLLTCLWGEKERILVSDVTEPDAHFQTLRVTKDVGDYDANDYDIVIMAANYCAVRLREIPPKGSVGSPELTTTAPAVKFFAEAMKNKHIIKAAMCHALWILTPFPNLLQARRVICHTVVLADIHNAGAIFVPDPRGYVVDDDLVTARSVANLQEYFAAIVAQTRTR